MGGNIIVVHYARIMKDKIKILFTIIVLLFFIEIAAQAQSHNLPEPQMREDGPNVPPPPPGLPIDFGISALIAAGLGLGIHHIRNRK